MSKVLSTLLMCSFLASCGGTSTSQSVSASVTDEKPVVEEPVEEVAKRYDCANCSPAEKRTLEFLQDRGITDKYALATVMGNIKQESKFTPNVCEGGAIVPYERCYSGGYGLIQWTTVNRYMGLGTFASKYDCSPSELNCQLRYMVTEPQWIKASETFKTPGLTVDRYMNAAYYWLGWGIHGNRTYYTRQFANWIA